MPTRLNDHDRLRYKFAKLQINFLRTRDFSFFLLVNHLPIQLETKINYHCKKKSFLLSISPTHKLPWRI